MHRFTRARLFLSLDDSRHLRAEQEFCGAMGCFGLITSENPGPIRLLGCEPAYPWVECRCLLTRGKRPQRPLDRSGSDTCDTMSAVPGAAELDLVSGTRIRRWQVGKQLDT